LRLRVKICSLRCITEVSRKDAKPLRSKFEDGSSEIGVRSFGVGRLGVCCQINLDHDYDYEHEQEQEH